MDYKERLTDDDERMLSVRIEKQFGGDERDGRNGERERARECAFTLDVEFSAHGGTTILFGPSGSGKTTVLRAIAGIVTPDAGIITLDDRLFFDSARRINLPVQKRRVGFMFQDYALFPHLTAIENVAYGVRAGNDASIKKNKRSKMESAREWLALLEIEYAARQYPRALSGGESQRVALARALASDPAVMLLDEPLSAVDAQTRARLVQEVKKIQRTISIPFIYVTHDVTEAIEIGNHIVVLHEGRVERQGCPDDALGIVKSRG